MEHKIIMLSELGLDCWSALKTFDKCYACDRVAYCKLPEAQKGRIVLAGNKVLKATQTLTKHVNNLEKILSTI